VGASLLPSRAVPAGGCDVRLVPSLEVETLSQNSGSGLQQKQRTVAAAAHEYRQFGETIWSRRRSHHLAGGRTRGLPPENHGQRSALEVAWFRRVRSALRFFYRFAFQREHFRKVRRRAFMANHDENITFFKQVVLRRALNGFSIGPDNCDDEKRAASCCFEICRVSAD